MERRRARRIAEAIVGWFDSSARDLPWRTTPRDPYRSLVSEFMLQQTQVARVVERFDRFLDRFPTLEALAAADEDDVLAEWSGLGYYRRARLLHAAARAACERFDGELPQRSRELRSLPGVGEYTAGAIAAMVFGQPEPAIDANAIRVLLRIEGEALERGSSQAMGAATAIGRDLVASVGDDAASCAALAEGIMELGATVCVPRSPKCDACPVGGACRARREGRQAEIPSAPQTRSKRRLVHIATMLVEDARGRLLLEQRAETGLWAGMWQGVSVETETRPVGKRAIRDALGLGDDAAFERIHAFAHLTTHREVRFVVWRLISPDRATLSRVRRARPKAQWFSRRSSARLALSSPQQRILTA